MPAFKPIKVNITEEMMAKAIERDKGAYNNRSFMKGKGNVVGFLGEYIVQHIRPDFEHVDTFNYDFVSNERTIDVKTKYQTVSKDPLPYYEASVDVNSMHQDTQFYIFCRIYRDRDGNYPYGWILGGIGKEEFLKRSRRLYKGDQDGNNGYIVQQDCHNLEYRDLKPLKKIRKMADTA
jgi:hypothetical protein